MTDTTSQNEQNRPLDEFEDDFDPDLDILKSKDRVWLVKLPKWLLDHWSKTEQDNVELARIKLPATSGSVNSAVQRFLQSDANILQNLKLVLPDNPQNANIPREFTINMTNRKVTNTFAFSEREIHTKIHNSLDPGTIRNDAGTTRFSPYPKVTPKATSIVGTVAHECTVTPVINATYSRTVKTRVQEANQPKRQVQMLADQQGIPDGSYLYNPKSNQPFGRFTGGSTRSKAEAQNNKATRIPKNELLDLLFKCFQEYAYWSLKGLKEYIKQPESYLREALEEIAHLNKRGPYALKWSLKPHYNQSHPENIGQSSQEPSPSIATDSTKIEVKDEDDVKMEDAL